jgi:DNA polymerase I-like protein with 3'-5' exonuclease and polymerase domains
LSDDFCFLEIDQRQAEARVCALLADDEPLLTLFDTIDVHKFTAMNTLGVPYDEVTEEARFIGKTTRHAGNLGVKKRRLMTQVNTDAKKYHIDISISEWKAGQILEAFHAFSPNIRGVFHAGVEKAIKDTGVLISPNGRRRQFLGRREGNFWEESFSQIPQSTVSDQTKLAALNFRTRRPDVPILVESHDALVTMQRVSEAKAVAQILKEEFEREINFDRCSLSRRPLRIPSEVKIAYDNYRNFQKFEF